MKTLFDIEKFSFGQLTSNSNGKTCPSATIGFFSGVVGLLGFICGIVDKFMHNSLDIMTQSIILLGIGATLLGHNLYMNGKFPEKVNLVNDDNSTPEVKTEIKTVETKTDDVAATTDNDTEEEKKD
jgi:hypothetical protein